jgi:hypothetical protein
MNPDKSLPDTFYSLLKKASCLFQNTITNNVIFGYLTPSMNQQSSILPEQPCSFSRRLKCIDFQPPATTLHRGLLRLVACAAAQKPGERT